MKVLFKCSLVFCLLVSVSFFGCKKEPTAQSTESVEKEELEIKITKEDIDGLSYDDYSVSEAVQEIVVDWDGYEQVAASVSFLKTADLSFFKSDMEVVKTSIVDLRGAIPEALKGNSVLSRLTVVETTFLKLQNDLTISNISKEQQLQSIADVLNAWSYLSYFMNKKLEFVATDVSRPE